MIFSKRGREPRFDFCFTFFSENVIIIKNISATSKWISGE